MYLAALAALTLTPSQDVPPSRLSLDPLATIGPTLANLWNVATHPQSLRYIDRAGLVQIIGNVLLFFPLGWLVSVLWPRLRPATRVLGVSAAISVAIELSQLTFIPGRMAATDDVLLNTVGALCGAKVFLCLRARLLTQGRGSP